MQLDEQLTCEQMAKEWLSGQIDRMGGGNSPFVLLGLV
jgi:hypothetical protein